MLLRRWCVRYGEKLWGMIEQIQGTLYWSGRQIRDHWSRLLEKLSENGEAKPQNG